MKQIVQDGGEGLRGTAKPLPEKLFGSAELAKLIKDMAAALDKELEGVALAAPQIGVSYRLFIVRKDRTVPLNAAPGAASGELPAKQEVLAPEVEVYINPEIMKTSRKRAPSGRVSLHARRRRSYGADIRTRDRPPERRPLYRPRGAPHRDTPCRYRLNSYISAHLA